MLRLKHSSAIILVLLVISLLPLPLYGEGQKSQKAMNNKEAESKQALDYALMPSPVKRFSSEMVLTSPTPLTRSLSWERLS